MLKDERKAKEIMGRFGMKQKDDNPPDDLIACPEKEALIPSKECDECTKKEIDGTKCPAWK
jgi:hypothetical protein